VNSPDFAEHCTVGKGEAQAEEPGTGATSQRENGRTDETTIEA